MLNFENFQKEHPQLDFSKETPMSIEDSLWMLKTLGFTQLPSLPNHKDFWIHPSGYFVNFIQKNGNGIIKLNAYNYEAKYSSSSSSYKRQIFSFPTELGFNVIGMNVHLSTLKEWRKWFKEEDEYKGVLPLEEWSFSIFNDLCNYYSYNHLLDYMQQLSKLSKINIEFKDQCVDFLEQKKWIVNVYSDDNKFTAQSNYLKAMNVLLNGWISFNEPDLLGVKNREILKQLNQYLCQDILYPSEPKLTWENVEELCLENNLDMNPLILNFLKLSYLQDNAMFLDKAKKDVDLFLSELSQEKVELFWKHDNLGSDLFYIVLNGSISYVQAFQTFFQMIKKDKSVDKMLNDDLFKELVSIEGESASTVLNKVTSSDKDLNKKIEYLEKILRENPEILSGVLLENSHVSVFLKALKQDLEIYKDLFLFHELFKKEMDNIILDNKLPDLVLSSTKKLKNRF